MKTVKIGSVGLGRLGYEHAKNIATRVPGAELTAICDVAAGRVREVAEELGVKYQYTDFAEMCANPELDAIAIVSPSMFHGEQIKMALDAGKHVFCDKPLDTTVEKCKLAEKAVEAHPDKVFMLGFMRRYDPSYVKAKAKLDNGDIGRVILVRSYTQDPRTTIEGTLKFAPHSGGQFLDMCVHDIDLVRWFTGSEPKNVWGIGGVFEFELYRELNDGDNVACMMQCENEAMAFMFAGRASAHGCNVETEIVGTRGTLRIASVGTDSMLEVMSKHGVCRECYPDFLARWHEAYTNEMIEFVSCIREGRKPEVTVYDGTAVSEIAYRCKESFECGEMLPLRD
ncbi:Gfo/Idh/MocA family oxidoreductase [Intestinibacillus massiliensis]|nr:Gfo/Idh/MocA family oxidoreductase [Intestinibacillus massiliensis]